MGLGDNLRKAWDRFTYNEGREQSTETTRPKGPEPTAPKPREPITLKPVAKDQPNPAGRFIPSHQAELKQPGQAQQPKAPPREAEAAKLQPKLQPTRTPGPGPSRNAANTTFRNPTSTFEQQQAAKAAPAKAQDQPAKQQATPTTPLKLAAWRREDDQAAEKQQAADQNKAPDGASKLASFRRPGQAPDYNPDRARAEQRMVDQFKQQFQGQDQDRSR